MEMPDLFLTRHPEHATIQSRSIAVVIPYLSLPEESKTIMHQVIAVHSSITHVKVLNIITNLL